MSSHRDKWVTDVGTRRDSGEPEETRTRGLVIVDGGPGLLGTRRSSKSQGNRESLRILNRNP